MVVYNELESNAEKPENVAAWSQALALSPERKLT
jgi:hypothetical protein